MKTTSRIIVIALCVCGLVGTGSSAAEITAARPLSCETSLLANGAAPAIFAPSGEAYRAISEQLRDRLAQRLGVQPESVDSVESARPGTRTIIAIGNMLTNPLITRLYFNGYAYEDSLCPAGDAYVLRVAYDPYPWRGNNNVIILGCETPAGGGHVVEDFLNRLQGEGDQTFLPYTLVVSEEATPHTPVGSPQSRHEPIVDLPQPGSANEFMRCADAYLRTGDEDAARCAVTSLEEFVNWHQTHPEADLGSTAWVNEFEFFRAAFPFEYCPLMGDELRLQMARILLRCADDMWRHRLGYPTGEGVGPTWNHNTEPLMGAYMAGRHFLHYYGIERCKEYVNTARECFMWQCKSWRSAEDSSSYLTYSSLSGMRWALAEWNLTFFESGLARKHADFIITCCDQFGKPGGFGDGNPRQTRIPHESLPLAFWYTRDADVLWYLNQYNQMVFNEPWPNPYWRDVAPERDGRFMGAHVAMMDPLLYARTLRIPYYSGMVLPTTTVVVADAVDKIAFREGWDRLSQFAMIDGFGRGYHLNYDTQAITTLQSDGEEWLMDHDYLERDSSRHTMLTVLFNGRCPTVVPAFTRLDALADFGNWGMSKTTVPDYNHADWSRFLVWRKGQYFLLFDEIEAIDAGDFTLDLGFRMSSWPANVQRMTDGRTFLAERAVPKPLNELFKVVADPDARGGKTVELLQSDATLRTQLELPAGVVAVEVRGKAEDTSHDTVWVTVGEHKRHCGVGRGRYGGSPSAPIDLPEAGTYRIEVWPREAVPISLDSIVVHLGDDEKQIVEAETLVTEQPDTTRRFMIQSADDVGMLAHNEWVDRLRRNRMYIRQRRTAVLGEGETRSIASLLVPTAPTRLGSYQLKRIGPRVFVITGDEPALIAFGKFENGDVSIDATCAMVSATEVAATGAKTLSIGSFSLGEGDTSVTLAERPTAQRVVKAALDLLTRLPERSEDEPAGGFAPVGYLPAAEPTPPAWQAEFPTAPELITDLCAADLEADGTPEILVARGKILYCLTPDDEVKWQFAGQRKFNDVTVGRFREGKERQVLAGGDGEHLHILDAAGNSLSRAHYNGDKSDVKNNFINTVTAVDINGDGIDEVLAGGRDQQFHLYDANLEELLRLRQAPHGVTAIRCADVDGDGRKEIFVANRYGSVNGFAVNSAMTETEYIFHRYLSIGDVVCDVGDIDGDGKPEVVVGVSTGDLAAAKPDKNFEKMMFRFDNFGYDVTAVHIADFNGDGVGEVLVGSKTGYVYVLDGRVRGEGRVSLAHRVGRAVLDVGVIEDAAGTKSVLAGDANGRVVVLALDGEELFAVQAPGSVVKVAAASLPEGRQLIAAAISDGEVTGYTW